MDGSEKYIRYGENKTQQMRVKRSWRSGLRKKRVQKEIEQDENRSRTYTHTHTHFVWNFDLCLTEGQIKMSVKMDRRGVEEGEMVVCSSYP